MKEQRKGRKTPRKNKEMDAKHRERTKKNNNLNCSFTHKLCRWYVRSVTACVASACYATRSRLRSAALCIAAEGLNSFITLNTTLLSVLYIRSFLSVLFFASFFFCCPSLFFRPKKTVFVNSACVLLFACVLSHWRIHFPRSVLFLLASDTDFLQLVYFLAES